MTQRIQNAQQQVNNSQHASPIISIVVVLGFLLLFLCVYGLWNFDPTLRQVSAESLVPKKNQTVVHTPWPMISLQTILRLSRSLSKMVSRSCSSTHNELQRSMIRSEFSLRCLPSNMNSYTTSSGFMHRIWQTKKPSTQTQQMSSVRALANSCGEMNAKRTFLSVCD